MKHDKKQKRGGGGRATYMKQKLHRRFIRKSSRFQFPKVKKLMQTVVTEGTAPSCSAFLNQQFRATLTWMWSSMQYSLPVSGDPAWGRSLGKPHRLTAPGPPAPGARAPLPQFRHFLKAGFFCFTFSPAFKKPKSIQSATYILFLKDGISTPVFSRCFWIACPTRQTSATPQFSLAWHKP